MLVGTTLLLTLLAAFAFGILAGYLVVSGILRLFAPAPRAPEPPATAVIPALDAR